MKIEFSQSKPPMGASCFNLPSSGVCFRTFSHWTDLLELIKLGG